MNLDRLRQQLSSGAGDLRKSWVLGAAGALVVLAVAIPLLLSHTGTAQGVAALPPSATTTVTTPVVATDVSTTARHSAVTHDAGHQSKHNPFLALKSPKRSSASSGTASTGASASAKNPSTGQASSDSQASASGTSAGGSTQVGTSTAASAAPASGSSGSSDSSSATSGQPVAASPAPAQVQTVTVVKTVAKPAPYSEYETQISLHQTGTNEKPVVLNHLARYQLLPADNGAFATYLGTRPNGTTAVFLLSEGAQVSGAGRCAPSLQDCSFLILQPGQRAQLTAPSWAGGATYTLRYMSVVKARSTANVVTVDQLGVAVVRRASQRIKLLASRAYGAYSGLLWIALGATHPLSSAPRKITVDHGAQTSTTTTTATASADTPAS